MIRCKKHPTYRVLRRPTADCQPCRDLWEASHPNDPPLPAPKPRGRRDRRNLPEASDVPSASLQMLDRSYP